MLETVSQNPFLVILLLAGSFIVFSATVFRREIKMLIFNKQLLFLLLLAPVGTFLLVPFINTQLIVNDSNFYFALFISMIYSALFFGLVSKIILQALSGEKSSIFKALSSVQYWFLPSLLVCILGIGGNYLISSYLIHWERPKMAFFCLIWTALTFALYPLVVADNSIFYAVPKAFKITIQSIYKWFYLFVIVIFFSGEFLQLFPSDSITVSWSGGYIFQSVWYEKIAESLNLTQATAIYCYIFTVFLNSVIAALAKLKLTDILVKSGYTAKVSQTEV